MVGNADASGGLCRTDHPHAVTMYECPRRVGAKKGLLSQSLPAHVTGMSASSGFAVDALLLPPGPESSPRPFPAGHLEKAICGFRRSNCQFASLRCGLVRDVIFGLCDGVGLPYVVKVSGAVPSVFFSVAASAVSRVFGRARSIFSFPFWAVYRPLVGLCRCACIYTP